LKAEIPSRALRGLLQLIAVVAVLGVGGAFVGLDPAGALTGAALIAAAHAGLATTLGLAVILLAGAAFMARLDPQGSRGAGSWAAALVAGLGLWGTALLALAAAGGLSTPVCALLLAALGGGGGLALWRLPGGQRPFGGRGLQGGPRELVAPGLAVGLALLIVAIPGLIDALAPPIETDELYYHLALPRRMLTEGGLVGGLLQPNGSRPLVLHLPYAALLAIGGEPRLLHLALALAVVALTGSLGRELGGPKAGGAAALLLVGSWTFTHEAGLAGNNLPAALAGLVALDAALRGRWRALGVAAGVALAIKYTSAGALAGIFLVARLPWRSRLLAGGVALLIVAPWWARNLAEGLHPLFPFAGWPLDLRFVHLEKYGAGRAPLDLLLLPWNAVMTAEIDSFRFLGRLSPAWLAAAPLALWAAARDDTSRRVASAALAGMLLWAAGPHWLRHLLPVLPIAAVAAGLGIARVPALAPAVLVVWVIGLPANLGPVAARAVDRGPAATGSEARAAYLDRTIDGFGVLSWGSVHLPGDARVAQVFAWRGYLMERDTLLGSVEDHVPSRVFVMTHGAGALAQLQALGATHVLTRDMKFLRKTYRFLDDDRFEREYQAPLAAWKDQLKMGATLLIQERQVQLWRLEPLAAPPR